MLKTICLLLFIFLGIVPGFNQTSDLTTKWVDGKKYPTTSDSVRQYYDDFISNKDAFMYGEVYDHEYLTFSINPFLNDWFVEGTLFMGGKIYQDVTLAYDALLDEFVLEPLGKTNGKILNLNKDLIDSVHLAFEERTYQLVKIEMGAKQGMPSGFYEISGNNSITMYTKYYSQANTREGYTTYDKGAMHYFEIGQTFYPIQKKKQLLEIFPMHKKTIKKKLKSFNTNYKKLSRTDLIGVAQFIDSLNK